MDCSPSGPSVHGDFPGKNTGVGCHFVLQGLLPNQGLNLGLLHGQANSLPHNHLGNPRMLLQTGKIGDLTASEVCVSISWSRLKKGTFNNQSESNSPSQGSPQPSAFSLHLSAGVSVFPRLLPWNQFCAPPSNKNQLLLSKFQEKTAERKKESV